MDTPLALSLMQEPRVYAVLQQVISSQLRLFFVLQSFAGPLADPMDPLKILWGPNVAHNPLTGPLGQLMILWRHAAAHI